MEHRRWDYVDRVPECTECRIYRLRTGSNTGSSVPAVIGGSFPAGAMPLFAVPLAASVSSAPNAARHRRKGARGSSMGLRGPLANVRPNHERPPPDELLVPHEAVRIFCKMRKLELFCDCPDDGADPDTMCKNCKRLWRLNTKLGSCFGLPPWMAVYEDPRWHSPRSRQDAIARFHALELAPASAPTATTFKPPQEFISAIGQTLHDEIKPLRERLEVLERKIDDLEMKQAQFRYCGVWSADAVYFEGNFVTHHGSLWHAHRQTTQQPGDGSDFTLCVKRGKDGKDADNVRRLPTPARTYGS
jgi:hypothetical protein